MFFKLLFAAIFAVLVTALAELITVPLGEWKVF